eukprot:CAMPEP_0117472016 /NCGR_PEP_ID=MMETSP0784-20121206/8028_1 /TAXON_ID=39447 /ORGANISM="" /LENGTH=92 /DNA_ID=CAMNT_0005266151 /DNA_START=516 /DNA_END=794 /DNA_ORIENTATION=+
MASSEQPRCLARAHPIHTFGFTAKCTEQPRRCATAFPCVAPAVVLTRARLPVDLDFRPTPRGASDAQPAQLCGPMACEHSEYSGQDSSMGRH